ncbi:MAG: SNF2 family N-terminal domain-containing protein [Podila humilis]|nr:MAG: SNF2 family N-terminal domain-containing protein [Podila humilis]
MDENMDREKDYYELGRQYSSTTSHPQTHIQDLPIEKDHSEYQQPIHSHNHRQKSPSPEVRKKSQAMSISQLLSDGTSRDVTPEFLEPSTQIFDQQTPSPCSSPQQWSPTTQKPRSSDLTTEQIKALEDPHDSQELEQPSTPNSPIGMRPITKSTAALHDERQLTNCTEQTSNQGNSNANLRPYQQLEPEKETDHYMITRESAGGAHSVDTTLGIQTPMTPITTAPVKKGRPKTVAALDAIKVEEKVQTGNLIAGDTPKARRGRKPKVKDAPFPPPPSSVIDPTRIMSQDSSVVPIAELSSVVALVPSISAVGAASKRTWSESPDDEAYGEVDLESYNFQKSSTGRLSPRLFSSDDESDQEDYSQHQDLMAYRLEVHKRAQRVYRAYEKQSMAKRRKLHERFLTKQQKRFEALEDDGFEQEQGNSDLQDDELVQTPTPSPLLICKAGKGGRRKKVQTVVEESLVKAEQLDGFIKETKTEKRKRERREAEAAALAKARELHGTDFDEYEDEDDDVARVPKTDDLHYEDDMFGDVVGHYNDEHVSDATMDEETRARLQEADYETKRRDIWDLIAQLQIPQMNKILASTTSSRQQNCKLIAQMCRRYSRKAATRSVKLNRDLQTRAKRATREMLTFWKRNEREELLLRKKAEKEAIEKLRVEEEMREARRQARKLNFLITQTELYSHFIGKKIGTEAAEADDDTAPVRMRSTENPSESSIAQDPDHQPIQGELDFEEASDETLEAQAKWGAQQALLAAQARTKAFDDAAKQDHENVVIGHTKALQPSLTNAQADLDEMNFQNPSSMPTIAEIEQPNMLMCQLKGYQIKGLNWLANLYEQGINGILADEMGLGKTVQSISLMAHLAETHNIWGPFLVIAPASTLHNWQQEFTKFTPGLRALPYWGDPNDRTTLRKVWCRKQIYNRDSPFHVLITSYQLVVSDEKYFQRVKWQYMVLDEAQAIKSSSSNRWKTLLGFNCRNRLLLTGTPIQNSMQELWALLHFIMPSLFDSHEEFSEWFSKDIESHAENKGTLNEHQLKRLHMILKPFMLRRIKKNVQNELGDKIELELSCELTARQRALYRGLKAKISVAELLEKASSLDDTDSVDSLMNLVMQFRKVCNHPELFERADVVSPLAMCEFSQTPSIAREGDDLYLAYTTKSQIQYSMPKRLYREGGILRIPSENSRIGTDTKYLDNLLNIWHPAYISESLSKDDGAFSFLQFTDLSPSQASRIFRGNRLERFVLDLESRGGRLARGVVEYEEDSASLAEDTFARFLIRELSEPLSLRNQGYLAHTQALCHVLRSSALGEYLPMMEPAYRPKAVAPPIESVCSDRCFLDDQQEMYFDSRIRRLLMGVSEFKTEAGNDQDFPPMMDLWHANGGQGLLGEPSLSSKGYSSIQVPQMKQLVMDSGKLAILDKLLVDLKAGGHRVLLYFQMTKMIDLMEEYLTYRQYKYLRLDGSSKISDRRDMVTDWQTRPEIFIFLLSTRAGGLGINLTAADTVIFYDSDWNPTVDQQAMDRAHRLGQTRQVTVYRLITKGTIEERILQRAKQKDEIQKVVISGGEFKQSVDFKPREIVSLLLDDDELAGKLQEQQLKRKADEEAKTVKKSGNKDGRPSKRSKKESTIGGATSLGGGSRDLSAPGTTVSTPSAAAVVLSTLGKARTLDEMWADIDAQEAAMAAAAIQAEEEEAARIKASRRRGGALPGTPKALRVPKDKVAKEKIVKEKVPKEPKPKKEKVVKEKVVKEKKPLKNKKVAPTSEQQVQDSLEVPDDVSTSMQVDDYQRPSVEVDLVE